MNTFDLRYERVRDSLFRRKGYKSREISGTTITTCKQYRERQMPVRHCIAVGCTSDNRNKDIPVFFIFPKVESALKKWLDLVRREGLNVDPREDNRHSVLFKTFFR